MSLARFRNNYNIKKPRGVYFKNINITRRVIFEFFNIFKLF